MPTWEHSTHMHTTVLSFIMVVLRVENRVNLKRYETSLEQIEQFNKQYDVYDMFLKSI